MFPIFVSFCLYTKGELWFVVLLLCLHLPLGAQAFTLWRELGGSDAGEVLRSSNSCRFPSPGLATGALPQVSTPGPDLSGERRVRSLKKILRVAESAPVSEVHRASIIFTLAHTQHLAPDPGERPPAFWLFLAVFAFSWLSESLMDARKVVTF